MLGAGEGSDRAREIAVYVDYAHTPDAIEKALASVKQLTKGKTIVVFGCGGDRDATKRPLMGKAALAADFAVVTSDNPRTESPDAIIEDIVAGMQECGERFSVEPIANARLSMRSRLRILEILYSSRARATKTIRSSVRRSTPSMIVRSRVKRSRSSISSDEAQF